MTYYEAWDVDTNGMVSVGNLKTVLNELSYAQSLVNDQMVLYQIELGEVLKTWSGEELRKLIAERNTTWATAFDHEKR
jgi:Ca2+-binding EF-hand superfamily protein